MASKDDVIEFQGKHFDYSFKGITIEVDGEVLGIGGVMHTAQLQGFIMIKEEAKNYPRLFVKGIRLMREIMSEYKQPIYAKPKPTEETAIGFLKHIGFEHDCNGVYKWTR